MSTAENKAIINRTWNELFDEGRLDLADEVFDSGYGSIAGQIEKALP